MRRMRSITVRQAPIVIIILTFAAISFAQQASPTPPSEQFVSNDGLAVERLIELGAARRNDLLAARQRLAIAEGRLLQAGLRPNPTLDAEYGSPRFLGGEAERNFSAGISQTFELGGKRNYRVAVARLELQQARAEILGIERQIAVEIRTSYANVLASARQLDLLEELITADQEMLRAAEARLKEGDVAPLDVNLIKVEADRLKVQVIQLRSDLDTGLLRLKTSTGAELNEVLRLAPQPDRPPRLDMGVSELTDLALNERADLQAAKIGEQLGSARVGLARADSVPNIAGSIKYSRNKQIIDFPPVLNVPPFPQTDNELTFGVSIGLPIFNRNQGAIAAAAAEKIQAEKQRAFLEATVRRDVAVGYRKYRAAAEAVVLYTTQILPRAEENLSSVRAAYGIGEFSIFDVVSEQRRLTESVTGYNQSLRDYYIALTELETAIGTTIPAAGLSPGSTLILSPETPPKQFDREKFLKSIQASEPPKTGVLVNAIPKKQ